ncbi:MAG: GIY-YIG nuclease family protein [Kiritimatiellaeota bacterium]|nr:GIY-YIG nuclease family protein [Kiritimatiellota bacterium]
MLWSPDGQRFYIGIAEDVQRRLTEHNAGISKWTKRYAGTWKLVWHELCPTLGHARKLENWLKRQKRGRGFWQRTGLCRSDFRQSGS